MFDYNMIIDRYYPAGTPLRDIYLRHCRSVAGKALELARNRHLPLDSDEIEAAAMLHDIGIFMTDADGIHCHGTEPYLAHGRLGADLLRKEAAPEKYARVAERHTGTGLTHDDIKKLNGTLPDDRSYMPETALERLICYADKYFSKNGDMKEKSPDRIEASLSRFGSHAVDRFRQMRQEFD